MDTPALFPMDAIRTDGWFERIGESVGSFQALCDIVGERFFAFSMITGARITALTVDRRNPDSTLVDFVVGVSEEEATSADTQRLTLADFRRRLVSALMAEEPIGPIPQRASDTEAIQLHIGVRYLLLAPLYGYSMEELRISDEGSELRLLHDGIEEVYALATFRMRVLAHVREDLDRASRGASRGAIDLSRMPEAEAAAERDDHNTVIELLAAWPAPLTIFLRTPEGQTATPDTRNSIARGLGLLGTACAAVGDVGQAEEVLRLAIQYAGDGPNAGDIYSRLGDALLGDDRAGEAIGALRRAANLRSDGTLVWPKLAEAFISRGRYAAAWGALIEAREAGCEAAVLFKSEEAVKKHLGASLDALTPLLG